MKPAGAWALLVALLGATVAAFFAPWEAVLGATVVGVLALPRGRRLFLGFGLFTVLLDAALLAWADPGPGAVWMLGPVGLGTDGAVRGAVGGLRLVAVLAANLAVLQRVRPARFLDALHLPPRPTAFLAALLIATQDLGRDAARLRDARRMDGSWPEGRVARAVAAAGLVTPLLVLAVQRARTRRDALHLAGIPVRPGFVPLVAVTAAALAGRLALVAIPNVSLTYVVVFAGGLAFGPLVGMGAGALAMGLSDLLLSGLVPTAFVNVPAMALLGLAGGAFGRFGLGQGDGARALHAAVGILATLLFSVAADTTEWLLVPEFRGDMEFLAVRLVGGLVFNAVPALSNGVLFAFVVGPVQRAFASAAPHRTSVVAQASDAAPGV